MKPPVEVVAALVEARRRGGKVGIVGPFGRGAYKAVQLGLAEEVEGCAELNLRGQDVADEAIALVAKVARR